MRRVVTVIVTTIGGLALLASFHTTPGVATKVFVHGRPALQPPAGGPPPTKNPGPSSEATTVPSTATAPASAPTPTSTPATSASRTIVGPVETNFYGDVQVEIVVRGGQLVDVEATVLPSDRNRSREINSIAGPALRQEALQAHNANIDIISGATYTSVGYAQSLQAALDQAGI